MEGLEPTTVRVPSGPGRTRPLGGMVPGQRVEGPAPEPVQEEFPEPPADTEEFRELAYPVFQAYVNQHGAFPSAEQLDIHLTDGHGVRHPRSAALLRRLMPEFKNRYQAELEAEHIA